MESKRLANTNRSGTSQNTKKVFPNGVKRLGTCERVESETTQGTFHSPSFHTNTSPKFHVANIQKLLTKKELKKKGIIIKEIEKIKFLREMCKEERPYFLAFAETWLNDKMKEAEYEIEGYSYVASAGMIWCYKKVYATQLFLALPTKRSMLLWLLCIFGAF